MNDAYIFTFGVVFFLFYKNKYMNLFTHKSTIDKKKNMHNYKIKET